MADSRRFNLNISKAKRRKEKIRLKQSLEKAIYSTISKKAFVVPETSSQGKKGWKND